MHIISDNPVTRIDTLLQDTWLFVLGVKNNPPAFTSAAVYRQAMTLVEDVRRALAEQGVAEHHISAITYAQCALMDEAVLARLSPGLNNDNNNTNLTWHATPLQAHFFLTFRAGEQIFEQIKETLREPAPDIGVLTCYQRILSLGFKGKYHHENAPERQKLLDSLSALVPAFELPLTSPLIVHYRPRARDTLLRSRGFWLIAAAMLTVGVIFGLHVSLQHLLQSSLPG